MWSKRCAALKEQDGRELQVHGGIDLLQTLLPAGVVDELRVLTFPVVLGHGKRLFGEGAARPRCAWCAAARPARVW